MPTRPEKLSSIKDKDTVVSPVKVYTRECGYRGCAFQTGDHMPSAKEYHKWLLENHFGNEHTVPPLEMLEGAVDRDSWNTFVEWWRHYTAIMMYPGEDHRRSVLQMRLGAVGTALCDKLGDVYFKLSELDLLLEVMEITRNAPEQPPKQEQLVGDMIAVDEVPFKEQEKTIGAENRFKADEVTVDKQEVTIGNGNVIMATKVTGGYILKVLNTKLKDLKPDLTPDLKSSKTVEAASVAIESVMWAKLGEPVVVNAPRADPEQEAAKDNAGRAGNGLEVDTVTGGSGTVKLSVSKGVVYAVRVMSKKREEPVGRINK